MATITLPISFEVANLLIWLWLEVLVLGCLVLWTSNTASILILVYLKRSWPLRHQAKRSLIDMLPLNGDLYVLPAVPKLIITIIRALVTLLVAITALGIDPGQVYAESQPSTHLVSATNQNFSGRAYNSSSTVSVEDFAVAGCEDITISSVVKFMAFVSDTDFSCNFGQDVGKRKHIAEVIWRRSIVREISNGEVLPVGIKLGERSAILDEESNGTFARLRHSEGAPVFMSVMRRTLSNKKRMGNVTMGPKMMGPNDGNTW